MGANKTERKKQENKGQKQRQQQNEYSILLAIWITWCYHKELIYKDLVKLGNIVAAGCLNA